MPEHCVTMACIECQWHVVVGGILRCNYMNRLGLSKPSMESFIDKTTDVEKAETMVKDAEKRAKEAKAQLEEIKKVKKEVEG